MGPSGGERAGAGAGAAAHVELRLAWLDQDRRPRSAPGANRDALRLDKEINASFTKLALVVEGGDAPITGVNIEFGNGQRYSPMMTAVVGEAARVRVIELPSEMRQIRRVQFNYGPITVGRPRVELWGKNEPVAQPPKPSGFNPAGWTFLGEKRVDGWSDKDTIKVPRQFGRFSKLVVVVEDSNLELDDFVVNYGRGQKLIRSSRNSTSPPFLVTRAISSKASCGLVNPLSDP